MQTAFVLWLAATLAFVAMKLAPGDPARALLAASGATPEQVDERRDQLGLDDYPLLQYARYLWNLGQADLGRSWLHGRPVGQMILEQLSATVELATAATIVGIVLGIALGIVAALGRSTWLDTAATAVAAIGLSTPTYWSGLLAILLFSLHWDWLPATGQGDLRHLVLPAVVLGFALSGSIARLVRARAIEVMEEPFVLAARARGIPAWRVLFLVTRPNSAAYAGSLDRCPACIALAIQLRGVVRNTPCVLCPRAILPDDWPDLGKAG